MTFGQNFETIPCASVRGLNLFIPKRECNFAVLTGVDEKGRQLWSPTDMNGAERAYFQGGKVRRIVRDAQSTERVWVDERKGSFVVRIGGAWADQYADRQWAEHAARLIREGMSPSDARDKTWDDLHD